MSAEPWIFLEPFYGGSHRHLVDGLAERLPCEVELWTLPARKWKWRMRGAALHFAERWTRERPRARGIFTSSLLDGAALRGLLPPESRGLPIVIYFHENQLRYPVQVEDKRDYHYGWTNIQSALAADRVLWNSAYNRDSFMAELPGFLRRMPDAVPEQVEVQIRERSELLPVPLDVRLLIEAGTAREPRQGPCRILWNHRWEHDKGPEPLFESLFRLAEEGLDFELAMLGQRFQREPEIFEEGRRVLGSRVKRWGYLESRGEYVAELRCADVAVSTALHEFQGLSVLEAAACGAAPLLPDDLVYPEIWPDECLYPRHALTTALRGRIREVDAWRERDFRAFCLPFDWEILLPRWQSIFIEST